MTINEKQQLKNKVSVIFKYCFLIIFGFVMIYPLLWLFSSSFKSNNEIFSSLNLFPKDLNPVAYGEALKGSGQYSLLVFFKNTVFLVAPTVIFTIISSVLVAYGFARFSFPLKSILFGLMISTLMLPNSVLTIPRYMLFKKLDWLDTYNPFIVPAALACGPFFIYMLIQFFRGLPRELEEAARIDGCNSFTTLIRVILPISKSAMVSVGVLQFVWTWNDFFNPLIYINSVSKYPFSLLLRMSLDAASSVSWNKIIAMSLLSMLPCIILFFVSSKSFVEGVATSGLKG